jgi:hypothetical protein
MKHEDANMKAFMALDDPKLVEGFLENEIFVNDGVRAYMISIIEFFIA